MKYPNFSEEKKLWKKGYNFIAGLDEAGRGPLAGPVVAAAVNLKFEIHNLKSILNDKNFKSIKDSKKLTPEQREKAYNFLINIPQIKWGTGIVSEKIIDKINILQATKLAMVKAVKNLEKKLSKKPFPCEYDRIHKGKVDYLLIDGNFEIKSNIPQKSIIKGDQKVFSISVASIIAKVTRDRIMQKYHKKYPEYGFSQHKGYPTKAHFANLKKFGPCKIHRRTFRPVSGYS